MNSNIKICVIGAGPWGKNHIRTLNNMGYLYGIVDENKDQLDAIKNLNNDCSFFTKIEQTFDYDFDGYIIATPVVSHYNIAKELLEKSKNILIEKPITMDAISASKLLILAKERNVFAMGGHLLLYHPAFVKMKELIHEGKIGKIKYIYSNRLNFGKIRKIEDVLWSLAPHDISLFLFFANSNSFSTKYIGNSIVSEHNDDSSLSSFLFENGIQGHIFVNWLHPFKEHRFVIIGDKGMLVYEDSTKDKKIILYKKDVLIEENNISMNDQGSQLIDFPNEMALENQLKYFVSSIKNNNNDLSNLELSVNVVQALETLNSNE